MTADLTPDLANLRRLAEAANAEAVPGATYERDWPLSSRAVGTFLRTLNPDVVLDLLDRLAHMTEAHDNARAEIHRLTDRVAELEARLAVLDVAVRDHHVPIVDGLETYCDICQQEEGSGTYPCPTIRALDGGE